MGLFYAIDINHLKRNTKWESDSRAEYILYYTVLYIGRKVRKYARYLGRSSIWIIIVRKIIVFVQRNSRVKDFLLKGFVKFNQPAKNHSIDKKDKKALTQNIFDCLEDTIYF